MRKLILIFLLLFITNSAFAVTIDMQKVRETLNNKQEKPISKYELDSQNARAFYAQNNIEEAMNYLVAIPAEDRTEQDWLLMGNIQQDKGNIKEAVFLFESALRVNPKFYKAYYNLGIIYFSEDKYALAAENFQKAKKYKNDLANIYYNLGCTYLNQGLYKKAKNELIYAIELKGTEPDYYYNLALVYKKLNNEKKAKFYLEQYEKVLADKI